MNYEQMSREELVSALRALHAAQDVLFPDGKDRLLQGLQAHQAELEMQNRALREAQAALEESRNRYADLYDFAPVAYCTLSSTGLVIDLNLTASTLLGIDRAAAQGSPFLRLVELADPALFWDHLGECAATRQAVVTELSMRVRGRDIDAELVSVPVLGPEASGASFRTAITDISRRKQAEASERKLRERLQALNEALMELAIRLATHDEDAFDAAIEIITRHARSLIRADMATLTLARTTSDEVVARRPAWIEGASDAPATHTLGVKLSYGGRELGSLHVVRSAQDDPFSEHDRETLQMFAPRAAAGLRIATLSAVEARELERLTLLNLVGRELTSLDSQVQARQAVARIVDEMTRSYVDSSLFYMMDDGDYRLDHIAFRRVAQAAEAGDRLRELSDARQIADVLKALEGTALRTFKVGPVAAADHAPALIRLGTQLGAAWLLIAPLRARDQTIGVLCFGRADPEAAFTQAEQLWMQEVALRCGLALDGARLLEELRAALDWRETLLASISHDLRGPLSAITMSATSLLPEERTRERRQSRRQVDLIRRSAEHMNRMVDDLVFESMLVAGTFQLELSRTSVPQLLADACQMVEATAHARDLQLELVVDEGLGAIAADDQRMLRVLSNLIGNAVKFSPPGASISVRAQRRQDHVLFSVTDHGPGIALEQQPLVFKRYWRGSRGSRGPGLGLGLYIAKAIVEAHGGQLWVESRPGEGATFLFSLPT